MKSQKKRKLLMYVPIPFPFVRTQLSAVYGKYLPQKGVLTTIVAPITLGKKKIYHIRKDNLRYHLLRDSYKRRGVDLYNKPSNWLSKTLYFQKILERSIFYFLNLLLNARYIYHLLNSREFSHFQVRNSIIMGTIGIFLRKKFNLTLIFQYSYPIHIAWLENSNLIIKSMGKIHAKVLKQVLKRMNYILPISQAMKSDLSNNLGINPAKMYPFRLGIENTAIKNLNNNNLSNIYEKYQIAKDTFKFIYLGIIEKNRNLDLVIRAFDYNFKHNSNSAYEVIFVGDGPDKGNLVKLAKDLNLSKVIKFLGKLPHEEALKVVAISDIGLCIIPETPTFLVSSPTKLYEYLSCGIPIIATRIPEIINIIKESNGGKITNFSLESINNTINDILKNPHGFPSKTDLKNYILSNHSYNERYEAIHKIYQ